MFENFHRADHLSVLIFLINCGKTAKEKFWMRHNKMNVDFYDGRYKAISGISEVVKPARIF